MCHVIDTNVVIIYFQLYYIQTATGGYGAKNAIDGKLANGKTTPDDCAQTDTST